MNTSLTGNQPPPPTLADLAQNCARETDRFFHGGRYDPQHCFELFRRAILDQDQLAWEAVFSQYRNLVGRWVRQHPGFEKSGEEVDYFVNRAFEKIWAALTPAKFGQFSELSALLRYLKMCVHSVITDHSRSRARAELVALVEETGLEESEPGPSIEEQALESTARLGFWQTVDAHLNNEKERRVVYGSFVLDLKPRQLYELHPSTFASVDEVYLVKQNVLARFRRDPDLARLLGYSD